MRKPEKSKNEPKRRRVTGSRTPEMMSKSRANRENAKARVSAAVAKVRAKGRPPAPPAPAPEPPIDSIASAVRALVPREVEEPNGQRVIPGAGASRSVLEERPGDPSPYVLTLRMTRGDARKLRIVAAHAGFQFPAQWCLDVMFREMRRELEQLEKRGRA